MPEVDRGRVRYSGGSQGGGMGIALCALNPAIGRAVFLVPAMTDLCGFRAGHHSGWPLLVERQKTAAAKSAAEAVAPYFDAAHFAPRVKIPVRVEAGLSDTTCPPPCVYAAYNALGSSDKGIENAIGCGHGGSREIRGELAAWLREDVSDEERTLAAASDELCRYWRQITGDSRAVPVKLRVDPKISKSGNDAYSIVSTDGTSVQVVITGSNARSVLYGVYDLLERRGGCGWFWDGDRVPKKKSIDLSGLDVHEESKFAWRGIRYFAHRGLTRFQAEHWGFEDWKREIDWCLKKRLNLFMPRIGQDDLFQKAFPEVCAYPDASKPLPGQGRRYDNRSLFWPLEFRGELRKKVMTYAFSRGMMAPSDFGTMTHWYSRTPQDFLDKMKPDFLPQAPGSYGEPSGLVWDIRDRKWMDAYWRITDADIREYGRPGLLHTIGIAERRVSTNRAENLAMKTNLTQAMLSEAKRRHPESTRLLAG